MKHINNPEYIKTLSVERQKQIKAIRSAIDSHDFVEQRIDVLNHIGIEVEKAPMGSGGVGQIKEMANGKIRVQIGYGTGKHNYAMVAVT